MYKDLNNQKLYDNVNIGFEFEFFSPIKRQELAERLSSLLGKTVHYSNDYKSDIQVTHTDFKIEPDFSGGFKMNELVTGVMPYNEAIHVMYKVMNFIDENGFTTDRTGMHINISLNEFDLGLPERLQNLNVFKYILALNEAHIFEMWPSAKSRMQKIYKNSVSNIYPKNKFLSETSMTYASPNSPLDFMYPQSKYFGLNFEKLREGYLEVRYAGGPEYQLKRSSATDLVNYIAESLQQVLSSNYSYSIDEQRKVSDIMKGQRVVTQSIKTYENFVKAYPKIELYVDLKDDPRILEANYLNIRESLFELITFGKMTKGLINYDTETQRVQLKDSILREGFGIKGLDLINCTVEAEVSNCTLISCKVRSSHLTECMIVTNNDIRYCQVDECLFEKGGVNRIDTSYIKSSPDSVIYANLNECIVRSGIISLDSEVDNKTEVLSGTSKGSKRSLK